MSDFTPRVSPCRGLQPFVPLQALNVLMLKTLENSNRTYAFTALLLLTREPPPELRHRPAEAAKFFDLAVKCLIKISKALSDDLQARLPPIAVYTAAGGWAMGSSGHPGYSSSSPN